MIKIVKSIFTSLKLANISIILQTILLIIILSFGAYFRFTGIDWDENYHLHPDERFLTMVETGISPVASISEYFDTGSSSLNPHNCGFPFFVYGTLPIFLVRYVSEYLGQTGYSQIYIIGRYLSGAIDLFTVLLVFLITLRLFNQAWMGLLASGFYSFAVLPIQLSHYFTVDNFSNSFSLLAFYFAVCILTSKKGKADSPDEVKPSNEIDSKPRKNKDPVCYYILFGVALGLAVASKINVLAIAVVLPMVAFLNDPKAIMKPTLRKSNHIFRNLFIAAGISFFTFRFFQPYVFCGPGFFGLKLNPQWIGNLKELSVLSSGDTNFPPSLQWARRPMWFALENLIKWGLGFPLGILALSGLIYMGWRIIRGYWQKYTLIWIWTILYFGWQSLRWNPTMRYLLLIYPTLAIIAAWFAVTIIIQISNISSTGVKIKKQAKTIIIAILIGFVLAGSFTWAFAFTRIYERPVTRVAASEWIYQNIEGAFNLVIESDDKRIQQPITYPHFIDIYSHSPLVVKFSPQISGQLNNIFFSHVLDLSSGNSIKTISVKIFDSRGGTYAFPDKDYLDTFSSKSEPRGEALIVEIKDTVTLKETESYYLEISVPDTIERIRLSGNIFIELESNKDIKKQAIYESGPTLREGEPYVVSFNPIQTGKLQQVKIFRVKDWMGIKARKRIRISLIDSAQSEKPIYVGEISEFFTEQQDFRGEEYIIDINDEVIVLKEHSYSLKVELVDGEGELAFYGSKHANESTWDDALPLLMYGYNPFDLHSGVYQSDLNFEIYWDDNAEKLDRFINNLNLADYIFISSNRQWGSVSRIPERYPLTLMYYRNLIGCPVEKELQWCYRVGEPGMFNGTLGFELIRVFQSNPNIGNWQINTQFAEEALTVYDHPKVFIFRKTENYDFEKVRQILSKVDLSKVLPLTPTQASQTPGDLLMPEDLEQTQVSGGTWIELFRRDSVQNQSQGFGLLLWYLTILILGWVVYPVVRIVFHGLDDRGYPLIKLVGMLVLALPVWLEGSNSISFNRRTISIVFSIVLLINIILAFRQKDELKVEIKNKKRYFLIVELIFLLFFIIFLGIRMGNPDLWHPYKGGEKPMDFAYLNAVIKSTEFPPYDPWFAGGYINYYYFGFVLVAVVIKWLGIIPSVAYNFVLPTFFAMVALGAFSIGFNLHSRNLQNRIKRLEKTLSPLLAGIITAYFVLIIGNLGTIRMVLQGFQRIAANGLPLEIANFVQRFIWTFEGAIKYLGGMRFPFYPGDWYWIPSRTIPGEPITEFPFFTFLYADPHAHLFAYPITLLVISWSLSFLFGKWQLSKATLLEFCLTIFIGGVILGSLRPINTWDFPIYLLLNIAVILYHTFCYAQPPEWFFDYLPKKLRVAIFGLLIIFLFLSICYFVYYPFDKWIGQGYTAMGIWAGDNTPLSSYITHWGIFLFFIISWFVWEMHNWMANTPMSYLRKIEPYKNLIIFAGLLFVAVIAILLFKGVNISWVVLTLIIISALLIFRQSQPDEKRFVFFLVFLGLALTLAVELVVLKGDIGRMNTVFKFYIQAWTFLAIGASSGLVWLIPSIKNEWIKNWQMSWTVTAVLLLIFGSLFPIVASIDKIFDRMSHKVPLTLDGMEYMKSSVYDEGGIILDLDQDYYAIQWMQDNIKGSPTIVEANTPEYRWGSRFSIYTGLPSVIGWNWHQRQQRAILPSSWITERVNEIDTFYRTEDQNQTLRFIEKYKVKYIIFGQLEKTLYAGAGLEKFDLFDGVLWQTVFSDKDTKILKVLD